MSQNDEEMVKHRRTIKKATRLRKAAGHMEAAMAATEDDDVREALSGAFFKFIDAPFSASLAAAATLLKSPKPVAAAALGVTVAGTTTGASLARAYGGPAR